MSLDSLHATLSLSRTPSLAFSKGDIEKLGTALKYGDESIFPTSALSTLDRLTRNSKSNLAFDILEITEASRKYTSSSPLRLEGIERALEVLSRLEEPLVKATQEGYLHSKLWSMTLKGLETAKTLRSAAVSFESYLIEQGDLSFRCLCRALGVDGEGSVMRHSTLPPAQRLVAK